MGNGIFRLSPSTNRRPIGCRDRFTAQPQPIVGKNPQFWGVKKMKTKWGSCNTSDSRIWINLELAKKSPECLEYILVHELVHLHERHHDDNFRRLMDKFLPHWRKSRDLLKSEPLAHEDWCY